MKTYMIGLAFLFTFNTFAVGCADSEFDINLEERDDSNVTINDACSIDIRLCSFGDSGTSMEKETSNSTEDTSSNDSGPSEVSSDVLDDIHYLDDSVSPTPYFVHENGLGQKWTDGVPLKTYNREQALRAGKVWPMTDLTVFDVTCSADGTVRKCLSYARANMAAVWCYEGSIAGRVKLSESATGTAAMLCPTAGDSEWK